ncbi:hypothetical protein [Methylovulum psychrotolerans]|uniref:DNA gyrase subunit B n=1 Tax=Methylovulum psychrotolerans TaxID=1704499 RepID=A0A2S5CGZ2_9GAMM|nr:hypothetical protein [Methylovulum psychrotolerans]POZ50066.1 hypothetical protein AADEFJLK_04190 [Methylovulum psychrotolerans]
MLRVILACALLLYPLAVYLGIQVLAPWKMALALLVVLTARFFLSPADRQLGWPLMGFGVLYCAFAIWQNSALGLRLYPVGVNACFFLLFALSLLYPPPIVERLARMQDPNLSAQGVIHTRKVTQVWCVFFIVNGLIAAGTALWGSFFWWSLYNGFISYMLIGLLMGIEYLIRIRMQAREQ